MSRRADRRSPRKSLGHAGGERRSSALHNIDVDAFGVVRGEPGTATMVLGVACSCGTRIAEVWWNTPESGQEYWSMVGLATEDEDRRPVQMRHFETTVRPGHWLDSDCVAHGPQRFHADPLLRRARTVKNRAPGSNLAKFVVPRGASS